MPKSLPTVTILRLLAAVLVLPMAVTILVGVAAVLAAMDDEAGAAVLRYIALGCGVLWAIGLVCLVVIQAIVALGREEWAADRSLVDNDETDG